MSVGVFLSGSGARVTFHAGVVDALHELGVTIDEYVGASGGAIHAALAACGCNGKIWFDHTIPICKDGAVIRPPILKESLAHVFRSSFLDKHGGDLDLDRVNQRVSVLATERFLSPVVFEVFNSLDDLKLKLLASSSLPGFTTFPVTIDGKKYADGVFGYFYLRIDFKTLLTTKLRIASLALPTNHRPPETGRNTFVFVIREGKFNPFNVMRVSLDKAKRFYEDGYRQVMQSGIEHRLAELRLEH